MTSARRCSTILQKLSLSFYNRYSVGRVITRVINDVGTLREFVTWATLAIIRDLLAIIGIIIAMLTLNVRLSLLTFTVLPLMVLATILFRQAARRNYRKVRAAVSWTNSVLAENVNGVRVVQAFSRQSHNYQNFKEYVNRYFLERSLDAAKVASFFTPNCGCAGRDRDRAGCLSRWDSGPGSVDDRGRVDRVCALY